MSCVTFRQQDGFYGEELLVPRPTPNLEDHHLSAFRDLIYYQVRWISGGRLIYQLPGEATHRGDREPYYFLTEHHAMKA